MIKPSAWRWTMGSNNNVIQFENYFRPSAAYRRVLLEFMDKVAESSEDFFQISLNLAINGKWREWNESMPIGSTLNFSEDMLLDTGDEFVTHAMVLSIELGDLAEKIRSGLASGERFFRRD
jgi:hypothetical protein